MVVDARGWENAWKLKKNNIKWYKQCKVSLATSYCFNLMVTCILVGYMQCLDWHILLGGSIGLYATKLDIV